MQLDTFKHSGKNHVNYNTNKKQQRQTMLKIIKENEAVPLSLGRISRLAFNTRSLFNRKKNTERCNIITQKVSETKSYARVTAVCLSHNVEAFI